ncbi:MAG: hypothetical protein ACM3WV_09700 [Bacillota bacterium]
MLITAGKALILIDGKIKQFQSLLNQPINYNNRYDEAYNLAYHGTETLLSELFSREEAENFKRNVFTSTFLGGEIDYAKEVQDYKKHINLCISQLKFYKERIQDFINDEPESAATMEKNLSLFVSKSFNPVDQEINQYITGILDALQIKYQTGERYSKDSIPEKVQNRIRNSGLFIIIFVRRDKIEKGGFTTPSWLLKELGIAQGAGKEVIAWVEEGIKDTGGLSYEKEIILYKRNSLKSMEKATLKFLEALKEHGAI